MANISNLFRNRNFILVLSVVLALTIGEKGAAITRLALIPIIILIMAISTTSITNREFSSIKTMPRRLTIVLLINYLVMGGTILIMGNWLIDDSEIWTGLVVIAAVPPAAAAIPWTYILGGDILFSLISLLVAYLIAIVVTPAVMIAFLGVGSSNPLELLFLLVQLILIPLAISRLLLFTGANKYIDKWRGPIVNWSFFVVLFTIIGLNRQAFFGEFDLLIRLAAIAITASFGLSYIVERVAKAFQSKQETIISLILVGIMKNFGLASGISLTLFGERAAIPASIMTVFFVSRTLWLSFHFKKPIQA